MGEIRISYAGGELSLEEKCNGIIENCETFSTITLFEKEKELVEKIRVDYSDKIMITENQDENGELYYCLFWISHIRGISTTGYQFNVLGFTDYVVHFEDNNGLVFTAGSISKESANYIYNELKRRERYDILLNFETYDSEVDEWEKKMKNFYPN